MIFKQYDIINHMKMPQQRIIFVYCESFGRSHKIHAVFLIWYEFGTWITQIITDFQFEIFLHSNSLFENG